jgi:hypothetical protein
MSCCLMQLMDSVSQNQKIERLIGLEKVGTINDSFFKVHY